jgi:putative hydrolase of the HAD superfamily
MKIIFDLGKVLFDVDYNRTTEAFVNIGVANFSTAYSKQQQTNLFDNFEKGLITPSEFYDAFRREADIPLSDEHIKTAWNAMLIGVPAERYSWLSNIAASNEIYLLSNTNKIHLERVYSMIDADYGIRNFEGLFRNVYYSNRLGMRKPDAEIFMHVIRENSLTPEETIFIDDSIQHVQGALQCGLKAFHLRDDVSIEQLLPEAIAG